MRMNFDNEMERVDKTLVKIAWHDLVWATPDASIKHAADLMCKENVSSVVIINNNAPVGIITDTDLRRVIAEGIDLNLRLDEFLKYKPKKLPNLITADIGERVYEVLSKMLEHGIKHAIVMESGRPISVVTIGDLAYSLSPFYLHYIIRLRKAKNLDEIKRIITEFKEVLIDHATRFIKKPEFGRSAYFFESINHVVDTALKAIVDIKGEIPENLVYAATGSWGRREQFLLIDRDTFAIYKESAHKPKDPVIQFVNEIENCLDEVGFPSCEYGYTARNLIFEFDELLKLIDVWGDDPQKFAVNLSLLADSRALVGRDDLLNRAKEKLLNKLYKNRLFLSRSLIYRPPESIFGLPNSFDFKSKAIAPLEYPVRALAITNKILSTSTTDRIESLRQNKLISDELCQTLLQTYNIIMHFKIEVQITSKKSIKYSSLTPLEKTLLKNAIKNIKFFQEYIERTFI
ncbi:MAG: putative nucleotidyltransferase substrate binding domain-containing protein [Candidatus Methanomethyliaceae archaeon]